MNYSNSTKESLLVLTYHAIDQRQSVISVPPAQFRMQMELLTEHGLRGISLKDAMVRYERGEGFTPDSVVLTFDDGYQNLIEGALPSLQANEFSATIFVVSGLVGMKAAQARSVNRDFDRGLLDWHHLDQLSQSGIEIGSHSMSHRDLTKLDHDGIECELRDSRECLQQKLQTGVTSFAFPYGHSNRQTRELASRYYHRACSARLGRNAAGLDPLQIRRVDAHYLRDPGIFRKMCQGRLESYFRFRQLLRDLKQVVL